MMFVLPPLLYKMHQYNLTLLFHYPLLTALTKSFYNILNKNRLTFNWSEIHLIQKSDFTFLELK